MKASLSELVMALRCSATPIEEGHSCVGCPYRLLEKIEDTTIILPNDLLIDGEPYWESCDCDEMAMDAAEVIEKGVNEWLI